MRSNLAPLKGDLSSSVNTEVTSTSDDNSYACDLMASQSSVMTTISEKKLSRGRRKKQMREAIIANDDNEDMEASMTASVTSISYLETSMQHLEMKKQILALRKKFGDDKWLINDAGSFVQNIMGLERSTGPILSIASGIDAASRVAVASNSYGSPTIISNEAWNETSREDPPSEKKDSTDNDSGHEEGGDYTTDNDIDKSTETIDDTEIATKIVEPYDPEDGEKRLMLFCRYRSLLCCQMFI